MAVQVIGVVPAKLEEKGSVSTLPGRGDCHTRNLSDRKDIITADNRMILVALARRHRHAGRGISMSWQPLPSAIIRRKVIFYNEYGFYNELLAALNDVRG